MEKYNKVHFIGVGGIGMSGLARLFIHEGATVSGSDITKTPNTQKLAEEGVNIVYAQTAGNITSDLELVVYTEAMSQDHPEMEAARALGIPMMNYFEALGMVANEYYLIAVSGTHGKTTTTAMLIDIFEEASFDPTAIVGSLRTKTGSNFRAGKSKYFIVEACEYKRDFLTLNPDVLIITNIEHEHVDYYKNLAEVQAAFHEFAQKVPEDGVIITQTSDTAIAPVLDGVQAQIIDYKKVLDLNLDLKQGGLHNRFNAAAASTAAQFVGIEKGIIQNALENFAGTQRRFEYKGEVNGAFVYDDYAHHPTEIEATIAGTRELYPDKKLTVVFQSHTYSRTTELFDDFVRILARADCVILVPIYAAREENISGISSEQIAVALEKKGTDAKAFLTLEAVAQEIKETVTSDDVVVIMGAGDVTKVGDLLVG